jgi:hypothetical protein
MATNRYSGIHFRRLADDPIKGQRHRPLNTVSVLAPQSCWQVFEVYFAEESSQIQTKKHGK